MGKILLSPWAEQQKTHTLFPDLSTDSPQELCFFSIETQRALQQACVPFQTNGDVRPVDCRVALDVLDHLSERLRVACRKLRHSTSLAMMLAPSRYPLLADLYCVQENASQLMERLDDYRITCLKSPRHLYPRRYEITALFDKVTRQLENIPDLAASLEKDIAVQEQRLRTMSEQEAHTNLHLVKGSIAHKEEHA